jgi:hypothetical protein
MYMSSVKVELEVWLVTRQVRKWPIPLKIN